MLSIGQPGQERNGNNILAIKIPRSLSHKKAMISHHREPWITELPPGVNSSGSEERKKHENLCALQAYALKSIFAVSLKFPLFDTHQKKPDRIYCRLQAVS